MTQQSRESEQFLLLEANIGTWRRRSQSCQSPLMKRESPSREQAPKWLCHPVPPFSAPMLMPRQDDSETSPAPCPYRSLAWEAEQLQGARKPDRWKQENGLPGKEWVCQTGAMSQQVSSADPSPAMRRCRVAWGMPKRRHTPPPAPLPSTAIST